MIVKRTVTQLINIDIQEITLLSEEAFIKAKKFIKPINNCWWLQSPGASSEVVACVSYNFNCIFGCIVNNSNVFVRPALRIGNLKTSNLRIGSSFRMGSYVWTVISDELALCDEAVGKSAYREDWQAKDANEYEVSNVKKWLEKWTEEKGIICTNYVQNRIFYDSFKTDTISLLKPKLVENPGFLHFLKENGMTFDEYAENAILPEIVSAYANHCLCNGKEMVWYDDESVWCADEGLLEQLKRRIEMEKHYGKEKKEI